MKRRAGHILGAYFTVIAKCLPGDMIHDVAPSSAAKQTTKSRLEAIDAANAKRARKMAKRKGFT